MGTLSANEPLLSSREVENDDDAKKIPFFVPLVKWVLKTIITLTFVVWVSLIFLYPGKFVQGFFRRWIGATSETLFGITGSIFLVFSGPILLMTVLSFGYLIASPSDDFHEKKKKLKFPSFRLWTFPVLVDGPFGVVSAAELIGILLFAAYIVWAVTAYTIEGQNLLSKFNLPLWQESYLMLELSGLRFGSIGLFCLAFLFLPITRSSFLLRIIDIPFEHATRYHVWLGHLTMFIFTLHGLCYIVAWTMQGRLVEEMLQWADIGVANLPGVISLLAGLLMWITSFYPVRKQYFELFFYTHQLYIVFFVFMAMHVGDFIFSIAAGGIFLFLLDRFLRFCQSRKTVNLISATCLPCGTVELVVSKPKNLPYNALSFIFIQVRELSFLQWHPFSVSSSPLDGENHLAVLIKVLGEWTEKLKHNISKIPEPDKKVTDQLLPTITASVEGPYGHESPYHLMYENLILVAGGIGISPFLAILSDIFHRIESKSCLPKNILVIWAVKRSKELTLLSSIDLDSICPSFSEKLHLEIQAYVTQELDPPLEEGEVFKSISRSYLSVTGRSPMSSLAGTVNNIWPGLYVISSTIGFIILLTLMDLFYINPYGVSCWWLRGLLFVACMVGSVLVFGGFVVLSWYLCERRDSKNEEFTKDGDIKGISEKANQSMTHPPANETTIASSTKTQYGCRPNFQKIFNSISESWGNVDIGVMVCGPPALQSSVAKECRSQNMKGRKGRTFFHFNSHSFEL